MRPIPRTARARTNKALIDALIRKGVRTAAEVEQISAEAARAEITARGSDSTLHVVKALAAAFEAETGQKIALEGGGSGAGSKGALSGEVALAFPSRELNAAEKTAGLVGLPYAKDAVVVIVHRHNPVTTLALPELKDIYTGKKETWADGTPVVAFNRNRDSGTREVFQEHVLAKAQFSPKAAVKHDGVLLGSVQKIPTSGAYSSFGEVDETKVKSVAIGGLAPTRASVHDGTYPLVRTPTFATKGPAAGPARDFIAFALGAKGQAVVARAGLISIK